MRSRSKNTGYIFLVNRKFILGVIFLSVVLYGLAGTAGFESAEAGTGNLEAMPGHTEQLIQTTGDQVEIEAENEGSDQAALWQTIRMRVTAYCWCWRCCGKHSDGITASSYMIKLRDTFVAADRMYSFGTEMIIPGYNNSQPVKVLDRGGAIRGNRLDVFFNSHQKALEWGVQHLSVKVRAI